MEDLMEEERERDHRVIKGLLDIIKSDWIRQCESLQSNHGFHLNKLLAHKMHRIVEEAEELVEYDRKDNPFRAR
jgi:hypothetical protein